MRTIASEKLVETGGCASPRLTAARNLGCFKGAVRSFLTHTGTQDFHSQWERDDAEPGREFKLTVRG